MNLQPPSPARKVTAGDPQTAMVVGTERVGKGYAHAALDLLTTWRTANAISGRVYALVHHKRRPGMSKRV